MNNFALLGALPELPMLVLPSAKPKPTPKRAKTANTPRKTPTCTIDPNSPTIASQLAHNANTPSWIAMMPLCYSGYFLDDYTSECWNAQQQNGGN